MRSVTQKHCKSRAPAVYFLNLALRLGAVLLLKGMVGSLPLLMAFRGPSWLTIGCETTRVAHARASTPKNPMPTEHPCLLNPRFSRNYINQANKVTFPFRYVNSVPEIEIPSNRCTFSMYLPLYWKVSKLAFTSLVLSSWQRLSTATPGTRLSGRQT